MAKILPLILSVPDPKPLPSPTVTSGSRENALTTLATFCSASEGFARNFGFIHVLLSSRLTHGWHWSLLLSRPVAVLLRENASGLKKESPQQNSLH